MQLESPVNAPTNAQARVNAVADLTDSQTRAGELARFEVFRPLDVCRVLVIRAPPGRATGGR